MLAKTNRSAEVRRGVLTLVMDELRKDTQTLTTHSKSSQHQSWLLAEPPSALANKLSTTTKRAQQRQGSFTIAFARGRRIHRNTDVFSLPKCTFLEGCSGLAMFFIWERIKWGEWKPDVEKGVIRRHKSKSKSEAEAPRGVSQLRREEASLAAAY